MLVISVLSQCSHWRASLDVIVDYIWWWGEGRVRREPMAWDLSSIGSRALSCLPLIINWYLWLLDWDPACISNVGLLSFNIANNFIVVERLRKTLPCFNLLQKSMKWFCALRIFKREQGFLMFLWKLHSYTAKLFKESTNVDETNFNHMSLPAEI